MGPIVASMLRWSAAMLSLWGGGEGGGGRRGEEDEDQGREVQGGVDEAQSGWEEEGGSGVAGDGDGRGPDNRGADAPPVAFRRGGSLLPSPVDRRGPVYGDGSNGGDGDKK
jgi:hypothetical protein